MEWIKIVELKKRVRRKIKLLIIIYKEIREVMRRRSKREGVMKVKGKNKRKKLIEVNQNLMANSMLTLL